MPVTRDEKLANCETVQCRVRWIARSWHYLDTPTQNSKTVCSETSKRHNKDQEVSNKNALIISVNVEEISATSNKKYELIGYTFELGKIL